MTPFDCEALRAGFPAQPVNTWSSLAFLVAAAWLWRRHRPLAVASGAVGVGSILFHGAPGPLASWAHDIALYAAVALAALVAWRRTASGSPPWPAAGLAGIGVVVWAFTRTGGPWCDPDALVQGHAVWHVLAAAALAAVVTSVRVPT